MFPNRLRAARKRKKLTQEELANILNVTKGTISNYENGHSSPSNEALADLANALDVTADYLIGRSDQMNNEFNPLDEINKITKDLGIKDLFFYDVEAWENFTEEDVEELKKHFEWVAHKARERNKGEGR